MRMCQQILSEPILHECFYFVHELFLYIDNKVNIDTQLMSNTILCIGIIIAILTG